MSPEDVLRVREIESAVLDRHHLQNALLRCEEQTALFELMSQFSWILRGIRFGAFDISSDEARSRAENEAGRALGHCVRWIRANCPVDDGAAIPSSATHADDAHALLACAVTYDALCNQHIAMNKVLGGRRLVEVAIDEQRKTIRFLPRCDIDPRFFVSQTPAKKADDLCPASAYPDNQLAELWNAWWSTAKHTRRGWCFNDNAIRTSGALTVAEEWLNQTCLPELPSSTVIDGFTMGDARRVLAALHVYAQFVTKLEDAMARAHEVTLAMAPKVMVQPWDAFISWLSELAEVQDQVVGAIFAKLTFDDEPLHVTVAHKPFVRDRAGNVYFVPRAFLLLPLRHTIARALAQSEGGGAAYSHVSNQIERAGLRAIADEIRAGPLADCQIVVDKEFPLASDPPLKPDMVILSPVTRELLVVELKYAIPPFSTGDVWSKLWDLDKTGEEEPGWKEQLAKYVSTFREYPEVLRHHFPALQDAPASVSGLLLFRWPMPIPAEFSPPTYALDWPSLKRRLQSESPDHTIAELLRWVQERPDAPIADHLAWREKRPIKVADWEYVYSVFTASDTE